MTKFLVSLLCYAHLIGTEASAYVVFSALLCFALLLVLSETSIDLNKKH